MLLMHANQEKILKKLTQEYSSFSWFKIYNNRYTLADEDKPVLEPMEFPDPVIEIAVEPKTKLTKKNG